MKSLKDKHLEEETKRQIELAKEIVGKEVKVKVETVELKDNKKKS